MVVLAIVAVLIAIGFPSFHYFKRHAEKAVCISHLKSLHTGFDAYLLDKNRWPQMPAEAIEFDDSEFFEWWIKELEPYGIGDTLWLCPSDKFAKEDKDHHSGSYIPTLFDTHQFSPHRWNQPWLMERGDFHRKGAHVLMPDGSITTSLSPFGGN
jgi:type II secretory pathway pseudopilin PulG